MLLIAVEEDFVDTVSFISKQELLFWVSLVDADAQIAKSFCLNRAPKLPLLCLDPGQLSLKDLLCHKKVERYRRELLTTEVASF